MLKKENVVHEEDRVCRDLLGLRVHQALVEREAPWVLKDQGESRVHKFPFQYVNQESTSHPTGSSYNALNLVKKFVELYQNARVLQVTNQQHPPFPQHQLPLSLQ